MRLWAVDTAGRDIYYSWVEGSRILQGADPYARILAGDMLENDKSIAFSMTRFAYVEQSIGVILFGSGGLLSRLPMLVGCGLVYLLAWRGVLGRYTSSMLSMLAVGLLTPVFFVQYMIWIIALIFMRQPTRPADV